jgi:hypothetical protein
LILASGFDLVSGFDFGWSSALALHCRSDDEPNTHAHLYAGLKACSTRFGLAALTTGRDWTAEGGCPHVERAEKRGPLKPATLAGDAKELPVPEAWEKT